MWVWLLINIIIDSATFNRVYTARKLLEEIWLETYGLIMLYCVMARHIVAEE